MKKIYLASFLQKENFGPGKLISIADGEKPKVLPVEHQFKPFIPQYKLMNDYYIDRPRDPEGASKRFVAAYKEQLEAVVKDIVESAQKDNVEPTEMLPFNDGDTLCSWERAQYSNYRGVLAPYLERLGYEVSSK